MRIKTNLPTWYIRVSLAAGIAWLMVMGLWLGVNAGTPLTKTGYFDFSYQGWAGSDAPTGEKQESKLWWNDGFWWGSLYNNTAGEFRIYRLNWGTQSWEDTGIPIDDRDNTKADVLWDGANQKLYVVSHVSVESDSEGSTTPSNWARLYRYTYEPASKIYTVDNGFPVTVNQDRTEALMMARDPSGGLWITYVSRADRAVDVPGNYHVYVNYSGNDGQSWGIPFTPTLTNAPQSVLQVSRGDIAAIVAFGNNIGIMWNNSADKSLSFAYRPAAGGINTPWTYQPATHVIPAGVDDHISLRSAQASSSGVVFAAIKTNAKTSDPITDTLSLIGLVVRDAGGNFSFREYSLNTDKDTRPLLVLDEGNLGQPNDDKAYIFVTGKETGSKICYKSLAVAPSLGNFPSGDCGESFIEDSAYKFINNASSMKQNANTTTGIVVLASDDATTTTAPVEVYVHNVMGNPPPVVTARTPNFNATGIPVGAPVLAVFSKPMSPATLASSNFIVEEAGGQVAGAVAYDGGSRTATFTPGALLKANTDYTVMLSNAIKDTTGLALDQGFDPGPIVEQWRFATGPGSVRFAQASYSVNEAGGAANIVVEITPASSQPVTVNYATANGTAAAGSDYTATNGTLTFNPGETSKSFNVPIADDGLDENNETVNLTLSNPNGATLANPATARLTIVDNEGAPTIQFDPASIVVSEGVASGTAVITVSLSHAAAGNVTVNYATADGTATAGSDYTASSGTLTFSSGQTVKTFTVPITNDALDETTDETVLLTLSNATNATLDDLDKSATLTIRDDDAPPTVQFSSAAYAGAENNGAVQVNVTLSAASELPVSVGYATADGSATEGDDYTAVSGTLNFAPGETSKSFVVTILEDGLDEPDEAVSLSLSSPSNAVLGTPFSAEIAIADNDTPPTAQFASASFSAGEGSGTAEIVVSLSAPSGQVVSLSYASQDGTATAGEDYGPVTGSLLFAPGETSAVVEVTILEDSLDEEDESFTLVLTNSGEAVLASATNATFTINDNDPAPTVRLSSASYTVAESGGTATVTATLSAPSGLVVQVNYSTANGTATAGSDYSAANGTLTFQPGETAKSFAVTVVNDNSPEPTETFSVRLTSPQRAQLGTQAEATISIVDDDEGNGGGDDDQFLYLPSVR